jgi:hypothetical protein
MKMLLLQYLLTPAMELTEADMGSVEMMRGWDTRLSENQDQFIL